MSTENPKPEYKDIKKLSPSRIETLNSCSFSYYANYILRLPDAANSGSATGSAAHNLFECLAKNRKKHEWKVKKIVEEGTVKAVPSVDRYLRILCKKEGFPYERRIVNKDKTAVVTVEEYIDPLIVVGLREDFYGQDDEELLIEREHEIDFEDKEKGIRFIIRGFMDKIHIKRNKKKTITEVRIRDYKSTKQKFDSKKVNIQAYTYQMFAKDLWASAKEVSMDFIFLQFPKNPLLPAKPVDESIIEGYKYYLSALFAKINSFSEQDAYENFAAYGDGKFLCGGLGNQNLTVGSGQSRKKVDSGLPKWICIYKEPYWYYRLSKADGKIIRTAKKQEDLNLSQTENMAIIAGDMKIEHLYYYGCPAHNKQPHQE